MGTWYYSPAFGNGGHEIGQDATDGTLKMPGFLRASIKLARASNVIGRDGDGANS